MRGIGVLGVELRELQLTFADDRCSRCYCSRVDVTLALTLILTLTLPLALDLQLTFADDR